MHVRTSPQGIIPHLIFYRFFLTPTQIAARRPFILSSHTLTRFCLACRPGRHDWVQEQCRLPWRQLWMVKPPCFPFSFLFSGWLNLPVFVFCFVFVFCSVVEQSPCFRKLDFPFFQIFCQVDLSFFQVDLPSSCWRHHLLWSWGCRRLPSQPWWENDLEEEEKQIYWFTNFVSIFHSGICVAQLLLVGLMLKLATLKE